MKEVLEYLSGNYFVTYNPVEAGLMKKKLCQTLERWRDMIKAECSQCFGFNVCENYLGEDCLKYRLLKEIEEVLK